MGDYASGTNHVLPTYGYARMYSGVSLDSFQKKMTVQASQAVKPDGVQCFGWQYLISKSSVMLPTLTIVYQLIVCCRASITSMDPAIT